MDIDLAIKNLIVAKKDAGMVPDKEWGPTLNLAIFALKKLKGQSTPSTINVQPP